MVRLGLVWLVCRGHEAGWSTVAGVVHLWHEGGAVGDLVFSCEGCAHSVTNADIPSREIWDEGWKVGMHARWTSVSSVLYASFLLSWADSCRKVDFPICAWSVQGVGDKCSPGELCFWRDLLDLCP